VLSPGVPVVVKAIGGDKQISITWAKSHEAGIDFYRVFRTTSEPAADDVRFMGEPIAQVSGDGSMIDGNGSASATADETTICYIDSTVDAMINYFYRLVAVDTSGNESTASAALSARAYSRERPAPPNWVEPPIEDEDGLHLSWQSNDAALMCLVQRSTDGVDWLSISGWLDRGLYQFTDSDRETGVSYTYRLKVMNLQGSLNSTYTTIFY
jgi:hypothetical protein